MPLNLRGIKNKLHTARHSYVYKYQKMGSFYVLLISSLTATLLPFIDPNQFNSNIYDFVKEVLPMRAWSIGWFACSLMIIWFYFTRNFLLYILGNVTFFCMSMLWLGLTAVTRFTVDEPNVTFVGIALWSTVMSLSIYNMLTVTYITNVSQKPRLNKDISIEEFKRR